MSVKKRKVALADGMILYGAGLHTVVKYYVQYIPEKDLYKLQVIGEVGRKSYFITKVKQFYEGNTLYKHGYRMYRHSAGMEKRYVSYLVKQNLYAKLKKIHNIMERIKHLNNDKMLAMSLVCDNMLREAAKIDRRLKSDV